VAAKFPIDQDLLVVVSHEKLEAALAGLGLT